MPDDLPTGYYLDNFQYLLNFVREHYDDLFNEAEREFIQAFDNLSLDAKRLYVRLIGRKGPYFRVDKLCYDEITCIPTAIEQLAETGLIQANPCTDVISLLSNVTRAELHAHFPDLDRSARKEALCLALASVHDPVSLQAQLGIDLIEPLQRDVVQIFKLLFFGNLYQDFTDFVLRDLGVSPFEAYDLDKTARYFDDRDTLEGMLRAYALSDLSDELLVENDPIAIQAWANNVLLPIQTDDPTLLGRYSKTFNRVARQLERIGAGQLALALYARSSRPPARERSARLLAKAARHIDALDICEQIARQPETEAEYEFAHKFSLKLCKGKPIPDWVAPATKDSFPIEQITTTAIPGERVEMVAQQYYEGTGEHCYYVENSLLPGLFGLYFWDVIFAPVKGVFFNPLQRGPSDLFGPLFHDRRQELIDQRLNRMGDGDYFSETVLATFEQKQGIANYFVNWQRMTGTLLELALEQIPQQHLVLIFKRLLRDLRHNCNGLPDLVTFSETGYCMIEIKGPGDTLQDNQKRWLRFFHQHDMPARVVNVIWA